jgi:D-alanyl-D-alanine carboxypeptidase (penicillin-binding protein 5/6)
LGEIRDSIQIVPARKGTLQLQYYNTSAKKWQTKVTYDLRGNGESENVTLEYPSLWKKKSTTRWRIRIPETDGYKTYISEEIQIVSKNIKTLNLTSKSAVIIRADSGQVLYSKKKDKSLPNASTTKMMTALLTLENAKLSDVVKFSKKASNTPYGCLYTKTGEKFYLKNLLTAMLVRSSNDAATALAEHIGGSVKKFAKMMNRRAAQLGCKNTHFSNPHGLNQKNHYSSAYDLALIQRALLKYDLYRSMISKKTYKLRNVSKTKKWSLKSTDHLLGTYKGFQGGKTGYTEEAGYCFCGIFTCKGVTYIYTVLGNRSSQGRWNDCRKLMNYIKKYGV